MQDITVVFENRDKLMRKLTKKTYEKNMNSFRNERGEIINGLIAELSQSEDKNATAKEIGESLVSQIFDRFQKRGKIKKTAQMELELFMIYYLFPAILLTESEDAKLLCDSIRDAWNQRFDKSIDYTTYQEMYDGFVTKLFGVPIGS